MNAAEGPIKNGDFGFGGQQPPTVRYGYGQQQQYYGQAPTPSEQFCGGQQQQQQYPSWAQSTVSPSGPTGKRTQRSAAAANASNPNQGTRQQGYSPLQASTDTQNAAQTMRDETAGRPATGTVEERRAQKVREARSEFRNAASREKFAAGQYHKYPTGYGMNGGGFEGGIGGHMDSPYGIGYAPSFGRIPYNQRGYDYGGSPSYGDFTQPQSMYGAAGGAAWAGHQQDEFVEQVRMAERQRECEKEMKQQYLNEARLRQQQRLQLSPSGNVQQAQSFPMQGQSPALPPSSRPTLSQPPKFKAGFNACLESISASPEPSGSDPTLNTSPLNTGAMPLPIDTNPSPFRSGIQEW